MTASLDPRLLAILACPADKGPLHFIADEGFLYNPRQRRRYEVRDGIPVMLVEESVIVDEVEHARITARIRDEGIAPTYT